MATATFVSGLGIGLDRLVRPDATATMKALDGLRLTVADILDRAA